MLKATKNCAIQKVDEPNKVDKILTCKKVNGKLICTIRRPPTTKPINNNLTPDMQKIAKKVHQSLLHGTELGPAISSSSLLPSWAPSLTAAKASVTLSLDRVIHHNDQSLQPNEVFQNLQATEKENVSVPAQKGAVLNNNKSLHRQIEMLGDKLRCFKQQHTDDSERIVTLEKTNQSMKIDNMKLRQQKAGFERKIQVLEKANQGWLKEIEFDSEVLSTFKENSDKLRADIISLSDEVSLWKGKHSTLEKLLPDLSKEITKQIKKNEELGDELRRVENDATYGRKQIDELIQELTNCKEKANPNSIRLLTLEQTNHNMKKEHMEQIEILLGKLRCHEQQHVEDTERITTLEQTKQNMEKENMEQIEILRDKVRCFEQQHDDESGRIATLEQTNQNMEDKLRRQKAAYERKIQVLEEENQFLLNENETDSEIISFFANSNDKLRAENTALSSEVSLWKEMLGVTDTKTSGDGQTKVDVTFDLPMEDEIFEHNVESLLKSHFDDPCHSIPHLVQ